MRKRKKNFNIKNRPIISLLIALGLLSAVLLITMLVTAEDTTGSSKTNGNTKQEDQETQQEITADGELIGVVKEIDTDRKQITIYDIEGKANRIFSYTGGTNITDKYDQQIAMSQIPIGAMVDASYLADKSKLTDLSISKKAWEYVGVNNMSIDRSAKVIKIALNKYKYNEDIMILDGQEFIPVTDLAEQDELTVWGYEETIWSVTVTRGHGTVRLEDYDSLLGALITIGYEAIQQITEDMVITVREGSFNLTVENGNYSATKNITVYRNKETVVSLSDLGPNAEKQGRVTFEITPFGADLYIDGELMSYASPLELTYGDHSIEVSLEGYTTYDGTLNIDTAGKTITIDLPEAASEEEAVISETDTGSAAGTENTDTSGNTADTDNSGDTGDSGDTVDTGTDTTGDTNSDEEAIVDEKHLVYVQNPLGASVYLDGDFMCTSPGSFQKVIGSHVITFIEDGYETMSYTIEINDDNKDTYISMPDLLKK